LAFFRNKKKAVQTQAYDIFKIFVADAWTFSLKKQTVIMMSGEHNDRWGFAGLVICIGCYYKG
jgi:hypothetical protein